jgi:putative endonuclease
MMAFQVYILESSVNGRFYVGHTDRPDARLAEHNSGQNPSTRSGSPWVKVYFEEFETRSEAMRREQEIKGWKSRRMIEKLVGRR